MIYPKNAPGDDPDLYQRIAKKAHQMWKLSTGTVTQKRPGEADDKPRKKKLKKKKLHRKKRINSLNKAGETGIEDVSS